MLNLDKNSQEIILKILNSKADKINSAYYVGSRAKGDNEKFSDIDICLDTDNHTIFFLLDEFTNSNLHYFVDIISMKNLDQEIKQKILTNSIIIELSNNH
jgi:predicted nucleotidyltransferase